MASGDTKTEHFLDVLANGSRADIPTDNCCNTKTQNYILGAVDRMISLEEEVEELQNNPDVTDIVSTYQDLTNYDKTTLTDGDVIRVLTDSTHDDESAYYRYNAATDSFDYIGTTRAYTDFVGTSGGMAGAAGLVPAPQATDADKFLKSDGTWATVSGEKGDDGHDGSFQLEKVNELPSAGDEGTLYLVAKAYKTDTEEYDKWLYTGGKWERLDPDGKKLLDTISSRGSNPLDIYKISPCGFTSRTGELVPNGTSYWCTEFIPIEPVLNDEGSRWMIAHCWYEPDESKHMYKYAFYDENKAFIREVRDNISNNIGMSVSTYPDASNYKYIRLQFKKSDIPFDDAHRVRWSQGHEFFDKSSYTPSNAITTYNIASGAVHNANLSTAACMAVKYAAIKGGMNPFDERDFSNMLIRSQTGNPSGSVNLKRLSTPKIFKIPKGTIISVPQGWDITLFRYKPDGTCINTTGWTKSVFIGSDTYARLSVKHTIGGVDQDIHTDEMVSAMLDVLKFENSEGSFAYEGSKISLSNSFKSSLTDITTLHQDGAVYNGTVIEIDGSGHYKIQDMSGNILQPTTDLDQIATIAPHANSVCFGSEKYDSGDDFPVFYNNAYNNTALPKGACYVYRLLNDYSTALLQTIRIGFTADNIWSDGNDMRPYGNFIVDTDNNKLYAFTMKDNIQKVRFFKFALPTLSQGSTVTLNTSDIEDQFDVDYLYLLQGACYHNGKIYVLSGNDGSMANTSKMSVVNLTTKEIESTVSLSQFFSEPETVFVHDGKLYVGQTALYEFTF